MINLQNVFNFLNVGFRALREISFSFNINGSVFSISIFEIIISIILISLVIYFLQEVFNG